MILSIFPNLAPVDVNLQEVTLPGLFNIVPQALVVRPQYNELACNLVLVVSVIWEVKLNST